MELNADFTQRVLIHSRNIPWKASPMAGVDRRMLDRIGDEVARATSIVRYAPGSRFAAHNHDGGEEFIVLHGIFQDEHGDYPAGTYVRNPPTTSHTPRSTAGCIIFVKLWQFDPDDRDQFRLQMDNDLGTDSNGVSVKLLHSDAREEVRFVSLAAGTAFEQNSSGGTEILIISGTSMEGGAILDTGAWLRLPEGIPLRLIAGENGTTLWMKTGHLPFATAPAM